MTDLKIPDNVNGECRSGWVGENWERGGTMFISLPIMHTISRVWREGGRERGPGEEA